MRIMKQLEKKDFAYKEQSNQVSGDRINKQNC